MDVVEVRLVFFAVDLTLVGAVVLLANIVDRQAPGFCRVGVSNAHSRVADERK